MTGTWWWCAGSAPAPRRWSATSWRRAGAGCATWTVAWSPGFRPAAPWPARTGMTPGSSNPEKRRDPPLVFAHRGGAAVRPEHTLDAYLQAIDDGVVGLECDVRLTLDGHLVCIHDRRLNRTSNGRG